MMTAAPAISGRCRSRLSSVVLPLPRNPVMTATGVRKVSGGERLLFVRGGVAAQAGEAVHARAVEERPLRRGHVRGRAFPCLEGGLLQRAAVGEGERPRQLADEHA